VRLPRVTEATITSRAALAEELDAIRSAGVAFDREEHTEGISAAGVVVLDAAGAPLAAISVPVPTARFSAREQAVAAALRKAVR
jgi:DNA-binding IclR family transcriptional regulator